MACPFIKRTESLHRQQSLADGLGWNLEDDLNEAPDDALTLKHLNAAIQLLTAPHVSDYYNIISRLIKIVIIILE